MSDETTRHNCGTASIEPTGGILAGSYQTVTITYTVGALGMDDGSTLKIASHQISDAGPPQFTNPAADNYTAVRTDGDATISASFDPKGHVRPWKHAIKVDVKQGSLEEGDRIIVTLGETSGGSRGYQVQTFCGDNLRFRVLADLVRTGEFVELPDILSVELLPGAASSLTAVVPSTADPGKPVSLSVRAEDYWGNVATECDAKLTIQADNALNAPEEVELTDGIGTVTISAPNPGTYRISVADSDSDLSATSNALVCQNGDTDLYWGDIHGQSGETVGSGTIQEYFTFARDAAFLDFASHAANDFQITDEFWETIQETIHTFNDPGTFVTFLCYEWSANTPNGGDHNVYFRGDTAEIHRSSNWQVATGDSRHDGTYPIEELYDAYEDRDDVLIIPHQGGRPATLETFDPELTPFVEIASVWGVFEWFGQDALELGYHVGFVGGSDDHTGRPGTGPPDNTGKHNVTGGLMAAPLPSLTREALWDAFKNRRGYATTGARIYVQTTIGDDGMGDTVKATNPVEMTVDIRGTAPVQSVDLFRGSDLLESLEPSPGDEYVELRWSGAQSKARDKLVSWDGCLTVEGAEIKAIEEFGFDHPEQGVTDRTSTSLEWQAATTGNYQGVRLALSSNDAEITVETEPITTTFDVADARGGRRFEGGELRKQLEINLIGKSTDADVTTTFELPQPGAYYVRVRQTDGELAWSSPIKIENPTS